MFILPLFIYDEKVPQLLIYKVNKITDETNDGKSTHSINIVIYLWNVQVHIFICHRN